MFNQINIIIFYHYITNTKIIIKQKNQAIKKMKKIKQNIQFNKQMIEYKQQQADNLDLSSIQDDNIDQFSNNNQDLQIQEIAYPMQNNFNNQQQEEDHDFRNHIKQLLITQRGIEDYQHNQNINIQKMQQEFQENQFQGEPFKGSFLRDMEILGKTMSFQSTCYNIYEGNIENSNILSQLLQQKSIGLHETHRFINNYRDLHKNSIQIQAKYIIDFTKCKAKQKSVGNKKNSQLKLKPSSKSKHKKVLTNPQGSIKSISSNIRPLSEIKFIKTEKKSRKYNQQLRKSNFNSCFRNSIDESNTTSLIKMGLNFTPKQIIKKTNSRIVCFLQKQERKKKIQQKVSLRSRK